MYTTNDLYSNIHMAEWSDISLALYKEFSIDCLFEKTFRYYLENGLVVNVQFKEWAMHHLWAIHHIDFKIDKSQLFREIDSGLSFDTFMKDKKTNDGLS